MPAVGLDEENNLKSPVFGNDHSPICTTFTGQVGVSQLLSVSSSPGPKGSLAILDGSQELPDPSSLITSNSLMENLQFQTESPVTAQERLAGSMQTENKGLYRERGIGSSRPALPLATQPTLRLLAHPLSLTSPHKSRVCNS